jgi:predicted nucleotidyltransferase/DNA-binding Xre family transcriptional regulator
MDIRTRISRLLKTQSLSIRQLSLRSGVRRQSIIAFLKGANLHLENLNKLLSALGCRLEVVAAPSESKSPAIHKRFPATREQIEELCHQYGIAKLALFGSVLRPDFGPQSDIDVLIEFDQPVSFFTLEEIGSRLKEMSTPGHRIDVVTKNELSEYIRKEILNSCEVLYEKAA